MKAHSIFLPEPARAYLKAMAPKGQKARPALVALHRWLSQWGLSLQALTARDVEDFLARPLGRTFTKSTRKLYRSYVRGYLTWLHGQHRCSFHPADKTHKAPALPEYAENFLGLMEATLRPNTCAAYRQHIRCLHGWLREQEVTVFHLTRHDILRWSQHLYAKGLAPATRAVILICVRKYLRYLQDTGLIENISDDLIRREDIPKLPKYLPRPLPPEIDEQLRTRLAETNNPLCWGLLLMRNTGLRANELGALSYECLRIDQNGKRFIKVPLGKLHNERLVPIDDATYRIVVQLRTTGQAPRPYLVQPDVTKRTSYGRFWTAFKKACQGIDSPEAITTHRMRHTYATTLLNAGMSLTSVMRLLGHRDIRMTLRYAEVTLETVSEEYSNAMATIEQRYLHGVQTQHSDKETDPETAVDNAIRTVQRYAAAQPAKERKRVSRLVRRLKRIQVDLLAHLRG